MSESIPERERELTVLQLLQEDETYPQRELARRSGMSLGMTNAVLRRLVSKGFVMARQVKGRHMVYAVTPDGVNEIARRTYRYFRRTMKNVVRYKEAIDQLAEEVARGGYREVVLEGRSDIDFLVEHACSAAGLRYRRVAGCRDRHHSGDGAGRIGRRSVRIVGEREARRSQEPAPAGELDESFDEGVPEDAGVDAGASAAAGAIHLWDVILSYEGKRPESG